MQKYNLHKKKNPLKETQKSFKIIYNSITNNLKFQHKAKIVIIFQKSSEKKEKHLS
jgi:hypothetical protein